MSSTLAEVRLLKLFFPERFTAPGSDYDAIKLVSKREISEIYCVYRSPIEITINVNKFLSPFRIGKVLPNR